MCGRKVGRRGEGVGDWKKQKRASHSAGGLWMPLPAGLRYLLQDAIGDFVVWGLGSDWGVWRFAVWGYGDLGFWVRVVSS